MSDVEVIVLDIDGGAMLRDCIDSIKKQSVAPRDVIVFDNGSGTPVEADAPEVGRAGRHRHDARPARREHQR